jgi:dynein light intermediate chain
MRVRDEHKMTIAAYQTLYQSAVNFGMRKLIEAEEGMDEL